jgi:hypothetical protein
VFVYINDFVLPAPIAVIVLMIVVRDGAQYTHGRKKYAEILYAKNEMI